VIQKAGRMGTGTSIIAKPIARPTTAAPRGVPDAPEVRAGLSGNEARRRLATVGPNAMPDTAVHPLRSALAKFWSPVPWMLEAAIALQLAMGDYVGSVIVAFLLVFNAVLAFVQEGRAQATLAALKSRLAMTASVRRDGSWATVPAAELVPGDVVKLSLGGVVAADVRVVAGNVLLDQSMLTGESVPVEAGPGFRTFAGALVRRGEADAEVTATGPRTQFGRTAELVRTAHGVSSQQTAVLRVVRNLAMFNGLLVVAMVVYARAHAMPAREVVGLGLTAVLASIPVALPATFTLAAALGARALARVGVLPTRLSAVDEAGTVDVLCVDKTGTLTRNELKVTAVQPLPGFDAGHLLMWAALASSDGGGDPVDAAIRAAAAATPIAGPPKLTQFTPFDPATKMSEAAAVDAGAAPVRAVKGAFAAVARLTPPSPVASAAVAELETKGFRVLAVAAGPPAAMALAGLIALSDPPRDDSAALVSELRGLGVRTVMVTGDAAATAAIVARAVGLDGAVCPPGPLPAGLRSDTFAVFAGVLPQDKFALVKAFQAGGHAIGMCGDGANDAPALRQAQMGIAVSTATDVAKSAAGIVLTEPGLAGVTAAVREGRITFQRILTYTINSVTKKVAQVLFLVAGLLMTGQAVLTPTLVVLAMITGDFLAMSLTTDRVTPSPAPNGWRIGRLTLVGIFMGLCLLAFCTAVVAVGQHHLHAGIDTLRTMAVVALVLGGEATMYAVRGRGQFWGTRPGRWVVLSSVGDVLLISLLAWRGILMSPISAGVVAGMLVASVAFAAVLNAVKIPVFRRLQIA
jgi:H+-transporting ATPase